jgi:hypothetical protein
MFVTRTGRGLLRTYTRFVLLLRPLLIALFLPRTLTGISIFCLANQKSAWFTRIFGEDIF